MRRASVSEEKGAYAASTSGFRSSSACSSGLTFSARSSFRIEATRTSHTRSFWPVFLSVLSRLLSSPFDGQMRALLQGFRVFGQLAPDDAAVPFGVVDVLAGRLALVRAFGGEREGGEIRVGGGDGGGVLAEESDERDAILIHGEFSVVEFPDWPGHPLAKPEREARLPSAETRVLEQGPKLALGEESGSRAATCRRAPEKARSV